MAQKYLMALEYSDFHASNVLKKHALKRPLGEIETKYRYMPTQPVLSCRTVDIDVSGTRTYRPKSSAEIINEQHALIHRIYSRGSRNIASAPATRRAKTPSATPTSDNRRTSTENRKNHENHLKSVEVQGRPVTSLSQRPSIQSPRALKSAKKRPKTTGTIKERQYIHDSFMVIHADKDLRETKRSHQSLTQKIHRHWDPESHDLNQGTYQRGKKVPCVPSVDSWLTFSGSQAEESQGIVDAFAESKRQGEYYNVEGSVGSKIAQQLQKGDKIRIGINGAVQTQDLKVKKWNNAGRDDRFLKEISLDLEESKENMSTVMNDPVPLSWDDQVTSQDVKVMTPRENKTEHAKINLCETRPVIFTKLLPDDDLDNKGNLSRMGKKEGFRVKQRKKNKPGMDGSQQENKVTVITIDSKSYKEEQKLKDLTVDEVIIQKYGPIKYTNDKNSNHEDLEKLSVSFSFADNDQSDIHDPVHNQSTKASLESISTGGSEQRPIKVKPSQPTFSTKYQEVDLDIIGTVSLPNGGRPLSNESDNQCFNYNYRNQYTSRSSQNRSGSARSSRSGSKSAKSQKSLGSSSLVNLGSYHKAPNEAEYIQISQPVIVKPPNTAGQKSTLEYSGSSMYDDTPRTCSGIREPAPSPELGNIDAVEYENEPEPPPITAPTVEIKSIMKSAAPALSISIPTADYTDSALNSPTHKSQANIDYSTGARGREKDMRDEQIDQITTLLVDAIIGNENTGSANANL